jgi:hypothetical protein
MSSLFEEALLARHVAVTERFNQLSAEDQDIVGQFYGAIKQAYIESVIKTSSFSCWEFNVKVLYSPGLNIGRQGEYRRNFGIDLFLRELNNGPQLFEVSSCESYWACCGSVPSRPYNETVEEIRFSVKRVGS